MRERHGFEPSSFLIAPGFWSLSERFQNVGTNEKQAMRNPILIMGHEQHSQGEHIHSAASQPSSFDQSAVVSVFLPFCTQTSSLWIIKKFVCKVRQDTTPIRQEDYPYVQTSLVDLADSIIYQNYQTTKVGNAGLEPARLEQPSTGIHSNRLTTLSSQSLPIMTDAL